MQVNISFNLLIIQDNKPLPMQYDPELNADHYGCSPKSRRRTDFPLDQKTKIQITTISTQNFVKIRLQFIYPVDRHTNKQANK